MIGPENTRVGFSDVRYGMADKCFGLLDCQVLEGVLRKRPLRSSTLLLFLILPVSDDLQQTVSHLVKNVVSDSQV